MDASELQSPSFHIRGPSNDMDPIEYDPYRESSRTLRSPSPSISPVPAIGACPELSRSVSQASSVVTDFSGRSSTRSQSSTRESLGSTTSRQSSGSYTSRQSIGGLEKPKARRGYVRPQGTYFAASAQSRESVLSLGSIAHLQYYFARTGLLDGKGGRLKFKNGPLKDLDLSSLNANSTPDLLSASDRDSSYFSNVSSPDFPPRDRSGHLVESPIQEEPQSYANEDGEAYNSDSDPDQECMLPPTTSTYRKRSKTIPPPPSLEELKRDLHHTLDEATKVLKEAKASEKMAVMPNSPAPSPGRRHSESSMQNPDQNQGWFELQGMHILDVVTLAIRAARMYYTAHDQPARLASIKSERKIRSELLSVMDALKRMATRNFAGGLKADESEVMEAWVAGVWELLEKEQDLEEKERAVRRSWKWLDDSAWPATEISDTTGLPEPCIAREISFICSMLSGTSTFGTFCPTPTDVPDYTPSDYTTDPIQPSAFLLSLQDGVTLIRIHNGMVKHNKRSFGNIPTFHTDTAKPYRKAENLRFWIKAAELRWEVVLKVDVMGVVAGVDPEAWKGFEAAIWLWCATVRDEMSGVLKKY